MDNLPQTPVEVNRHQENLRQYERVSDGGPRRPRIAAAARPAHLPAVAPVDLSAEPPAHGWILAHPNLYTLNGYTLHTEYTGESVEDFQICKVVTAPDGSQRRYQGSENRAVAAALMAEITKSVQPAPVLPASVDRGPLLDWLDETPAPAVISPAAAIAAALKVEYPALSSRIDKALELVEAGVTASQYETTVELANGGKPNRTCTCPDATHRNHRAEFGQACKHTIAAQIRYLLEQERRAVTVRKLTDIIERDRARLQANAAAYEFAGQPDALNRAKDNRRVYMGDKR